MRPGGSPDAPKSTAALVVTFAVVALSIVCCIGSLAAVALPNLLRFGVKSKQSEVKSNLKAAFFAEKAWFNDNSKYSESVEEVGFSPERGTRYRYLFSASGEMLIPGAPDGGQHSHLAADPRTVPDNAALLRGIPPALLAEVGMRGTCPDSCSMTVLAAGNIDTDSTVDVWSVSTAARTIDGVSVPAGTPYKHIDDVTE